jgi:hypothetical protein
MNSENRDGNGLAGTIGQTEQAGQARLSSQIGQAGSTVNPTEAIDQIQPERTIDGESMQVIHYTFTITWNERMREAVEEDGAIPFYVGIFPDGILDGDESRGGIRRVVGNLLRKVMEKLRQKSKIRRWLKKAPCDTYNENMSCSECLVCLDPFKNGDKVRDLGCKHIFHRKCLDPWLVKGEGNCPTCRRSNLFDEDE